VDRLRKAVNAAVRTKDFKEAQRRLSILQQRCAELGCVVPPASASKESPGASPTKEGDGQLDKAEAEEGEPHDRLGFARGILHEKFPLRSCCEAEESQVEDEEEAEPMAMPTVAERVAAAESRRRGRRRIDGDGADQAEAQEQALARRTALDAISDASYEDLDRFPAVAATLREFLLKEGQDDDEVEATLRALHELFAQDEKALDAMAQQPYADIVAGDPGQSQAVAHFRRFWTSHSGPLLPPLPRAERGLEARLRIAHGIPRDWGVRVVQRAHGKEDLAILAPPNGAPRHFAKASEVAELPVLQGEAFAAERARLAAMSDIEKQEQQRLVALAGRQAERRKKIEQGREELEDGLRKMIDGDASLESRRQLLGVLFRQQVACSTCNRASMRDAEVDEGLVAGDDVEKAEAAVERTKWTSYEDVPDATEEEKALYPAVLATFYQKGYPYLTGVRKLMELYKKRPVDMATPEFQRLVRHDPENAQCNGFLNSAILYLRKFREEVGFDNLIDISTLDPQQVEEKFTPDFTKTWSREQDGFNDLQIEVPLELLMADATSDWPRELNEKLDEENYIQEDVDARGHHPVALSISLLPDATAEDWALWPRILAKYETVCKRDSSEPSGVKREAEAAELFTALKELVEEHGKSPSAMSSRRYVKMIRAIYGAQDNKQRATAAAKFSEFWAANKDSDFPEPRVHALSANKYRLLDLQRVAQAKKLAIDWKLPEGWAVRLGRDGRVIKVTGLSKGETFSSMEAAVEAAGAKARRQASEAKASQKEALERQQARASLVATQASLVGQLREAVQKEDYVLAERIHASMKEQGCDGAKSAVAEGPSRAGKMSIVERDLHKAVGRGGGKKAFGRGQASHRPAGRAHFSSLGKRKGQATPAASSGPPLKLRKSAGLKEQLRQQVAAAELTLRAGEWRVIGVRVNGSVTPLDSDLAGVAPEQVAVVLVFVDEEVRERKRMRIIESWGLDDTWSVTVRVRHSGDQITARRADGKVFFHKHELFCERQKQLRQQIRTQAAECIKSLVGFLDGAAKSRVWQLEAKECPVLSGFYTQQGSGASATFTKVRGLASIGPLSAPVEVRRVGSKWSFLGAEGGGIAVTEGTSMRVPFSNSQLRVVQSQQASEQLIDVSGGLLPFVEVRNRLSAMLAQPRGPVCRLCDVGREAGKAPGETREREVGKTGQSRAERLAQYETRLRELQERRAVAPRTLQAMLGVMLEKLTRLRGGEMPAVLGEQRVLRVGTMCSGTDSPLLVAKALQKVLGSRSSGLTFEHAFSVEVDPAKQEFLRANFPECPLLFPDVCEMGRSRSMDVLSGRSQAVPSGIDVLVAGFSCKDLSMMNSYRKALAEMGQSGSTLRGVLDYVDRHRPRLVLLENVWAIAKANACGFRQVDLVIEGLKARGYAAGYKLLNTCDYFIPQIRHRIWMWGIRLDAESPQNPQAAREAVFRATEASRTTEPRFNEILAALEEPCALHFDDFMLDDDHPDVRAYIDLMKSTNRISVRNKKKGAKQDWTQKYGSHRTLNDYQYDRPYTSVRDAEFLQVLNDREKELLDLKCLDVLNEQGKDPRTHPMLWEISQSVERVPGTRNRPDRQNYATCILPGMLWHSSRHRWVLGVEKLAMQGIFAQDLKDTNFSQRLLGDLAGNAFSTTVCGANLLAALVCASDMGL